MRAVSSVIVLTAALVLAGCSTEVAGSARPAGGTGSSAPSDSSLRDALLPAEELPPGPKYQVQTTVPDLGGLGDAVASVEPPPCREVLQLVATAAAEVDEVAAVTGSSEGGRVAIGLLRGDGLLELGKLEDGLRRCPTYRIVAGGSRVQSDQRVEPAPGLGADAELHYTSTLTVAGAPPLEQASVVLRDGDVQLSVNTSGVFAGQVVELARASLQRKRDVLG